MMRIITRPPWDIPCLSSGSTSSVAQTIIDRLEASDASMRVAQLRVLGGAMARVPAEATAFAHRRSRIMVNLAAFYNGPEDQAMRQAWVTDFAASYSSRRRRRVYEFHG